MYASQRIRQLSFVVVVDLNAANITRNLQLGGILLEITSVTNVSSVTWRGMVDSYLASQDSYFVFASGNEGVQNFPANASCAACQSNFHHGRFKQVWDECERGWSSK